MNRSTPGLPVHHQLLEFTQNHVHRVRDAIQPSHPLLSPSPPAPNPSSIKVFSIESTLRMRWPKYWSFSFSIIPAKEHSGLISFRMDYTSIKNKEKKEAKEKNKLVLMISSRILAWRIPGTGEPGGLPSMVSQSQT